MSRILGFLLGSTITGAASYLYIYEEYRVANDLLTEDIDVCTPSHIPTRARTQLHAQKRMHTCTS